MKDCNSKLKTGDKHTDSDRNIDSRVPAKLKRKKANTFISFFHPFKTIILKHWDLAPWLIQVVIFQGEDEHEEIEETSSRHEVPHVMIVKNEYEAACI